MRGVKKFFKGGKNKKENHSENVSVGAGEDSTFNASSSIAAVSPRGVSAATFAATSTPRAGVTAPTESSNAKSDDPSSLTTARKAVESAANQSTTAATATAGFSAASGGGDSSSSTNVNHQHDSNVNSSSSTSGGGIRQQQQQRTVSLQQVNEESATSEEREIFRDDEEDSPNLVMSYNAVPVLEQIKLPRGGVSVDTKAVGRVQVRTHMRSLAIKVFLFCCHECILHCLGLGCILYSLVFLQRQSRIV
jgi:hypothetical protein